MEIKPIKTRIFKEGENLFDFISEYIEKLPEKSILVITSKIVSLSQKRTKKIINKKTRENLIKKESQWAMKTKYTWLTIKDGSVMASAGIDESNADGKIILLPENVFKEAGLIRNQLKKKYKIKDLGVMITDSRMLPLHLGSVGVALGYAGFKGMRDYRGKKDLFRKIFKYSRVDVVDSLAGAAVLSMGEGAERQPLAVIKNASVEFTEKTDKKELYVDPKNDIYQPIFEKIKKINWKK